MRVLITCGPTQEPIDDVRYITNSSSGRTGIALAEEAKRRGHEVTLVCGPISLRAPANVKALNVRTAEEMVNATLDELKRGYDVLISAAAIADFKPQKRLRGKVSSRDSVTLILTPMEKLTKVAKKSFPSLFVAAFKAEYGVENDDLIKRAVEKKKAESLDLVVANDIGKDRFGSESREVYIVGERGVKHVRKSDLKNVAECILDEITSILQTRTP
ncbi:MAG: phosphopantothenoylcysteine decarboxylase [Candidatus Altiarchaeota archaeon]